MHFHRNIQSLKRNETATISTLFDRWFSVWPIVSVMQSYGKNIDNFIFEVTKENWTRCYLIISFKRLNEITSFLFCWKGNII